MAETAIEWATHVWNPVTGCDRVSPGCAHCYAMTLAKRLKAMGNPRYQRDGGKTSGPGFGVTLHPDKLGEPLRWRKPRLVFVNSMSDLFHDEIPDEYIRRVWDVMERCSYPAMGAVHTFQILTKRPERMLEWVSAETERRQAYAAQFDRLPPSSSGLSGIAKSDSPAAEDARSHVVLPNVWLGVSIENRRFVHRADLLRETPAAVRFISAEPLLGPLISRVPCAARPGCEYCAAEGGDGYIYGSEPWSLDLDGIDWLICGGESGKGARRFDLQWARDLRDACEASGTAYFMKQTGGLRPGSRLEDLPEDLRIREMPRQTVTV